MEYHAYAGIGSRETPEEVLSFFEKVAKFLARKGFTLRSGHAKGADQAFENGCDSVKGKKEIYIPWSGFEGSDSRFILKDERAYDVAEEYHPNWNRLSDGAKKLQARNSYQVLGRALDKPFPENDYDANSEFILCWTKKGKGSGGTGQAIRIAKANYVPVFDVGSYNDIESMRIEITRFLIENSHLTEQDFQRQ